MQRRKLLVPFAHRERLRRLDETARALGVFFNIHGSFPQPAAPPGARSAKVENGLRPIALQMLGSEIWLPNRPRFGGSCARHRSSIVMGFPRRHIDIPQPAGGLFAEPSAGSRQMWEAGSGNGRGSFTNSCAVASAPGIS